MTYTKGIRKIFSSTGNLERQIDLAHKSGFDLLSFNGNIIFIFLVDDRLDWKPTSLTISDFEA